MDTVLITILVFIAIMVITALVFGGWLLLAILRLVGKGIGAMLGVTRSHPPLLPPAPPHTVRCGFEKCRAINAERARFCRRCGKMLNVAATRQMPPVPRQVVDRRVAV
jgi:hypothetical protein